MGGDAGTAVGARRDRGSGQGGGGKSGRTHNADGRWIWAPLPSGFRDGSGAGGQGRGETRDGSVDPRRRHAARFLSARVLPQDAGRAGCERESCRMETFSDFHIYRREVAGARPRKKRTRRRLARLTKLL